MPDHVFTCEQRLPISADRLYTAWTTGWGLWFADDATVQATAREGAPFFFSVMQADGIPPVLHPHYGRFLELVPGALVRMTWVTRATGGAETELTVRFTPEPSGTTHCSLTHRHFSSSEVRDAHAESWPLVLAAQVARLQSLTDREWQHRQLAEAAAAPRVSNRSMPDATLIPTRSYPDPEAAVTWLRDVLGCRERLRGPGPRVQLTVGNAAVVVAAWDPASTPATGGRPPATLLIRVADVDLAYARALAAGAEGLSAPATLPFGERQAAVRDPAGHAWTLSQTVNDVDPSDWGATLVD